MRVRWHEEVHNLVVLSAGWRICGLGVEIGLPSLHVLHLEHPKTILNKAIGSLIPTLDLLTHHISLLLRSQV